jgi:hypothetical protein
LAVTLTDVQPVHALDGASVLDQPGAHAIFTDQGVQLAGLVVCRRRDRRTLESLPRDCGAQEVGVLVELHETERVQSIEQPARIAASAQIERELRVFSIREAMQRGHVVDLRRERGRHVDDAAPADRGELRPVTHERERCAGLVYDRQERESGVLVEHAGLIQHNPLTARQAVLLRGASVGRACLRVGVSGREPGPDTIGIPSEPVGVDEFRY